MKNFLVYILLCGVIQSCRGAAPIVTDKSTDKQVVSKASISLSCTFKSDPVDGFIFTWLKDNKPLVFTSDIFANNISEFQQLLAINNIDQSKTGVYSCKGKNNDGEVQGDINVSLMDFIPRINVIQDVYLKQDDNITVQCNAEAIPQATYVWTKSSGFLDQVNVIDHKNGKLSILNMKADYEGTYICKASNKEGDSDESFKLILATDTKFIISPGDVNVTAGREYKLTASIVSLVDNPLISWYKDGNVIDSEAYITKKEGATYTSTLIFPKIDVGDSGTYEVLVDFQIVSGIKKVMLLTVYSMPVVEIVEGASIMVNEGDTALFVCAVSANPKPVVEWLRNDTVLFSSTKNHSEEGVKTMLRFVIHEVSKDNEGIYRCVAKNSLGDDSAVIKLDVKAGVPGGEEEDNSKLITVIVVLSVIAILIIGVAVFLYIRYKDKWCGGYDAATGTFYTDLDQHEKDATLADIENNPYAIKKNINISIKKGGRTATISAGNTAKPTGSMKRGSLAQQMMRGRMSVKSPTSTVENNYAPLDSIVCQGKAVDFKHIVFDEILGEGEYGSVTGGRLLDEEDSSQYKDVSIKMLKDNPTAQERRDILAELRMMRRIARHKHVVELVGWCIADDNVYVLEEYVPFGSLLTFLRTNRLLTQSAENLDQIDENDRVSQENLLTFASQIAKGMDHLSQLQIVHRDLACRNVYIGHEKICKISEYGLARDIYAENVYRKTTGGQLPVRWMAYESVFEGTYTTKSDVWSYGVLLWELCTLGKIPYPGIVRTEQLLDELESGYHMENPGHISTDLYLLMNSCWNRSPDTRPSFSDLVKKVTSLIDDTSEVHIDLPKLFQTEFDDENDDLLSPTSDFHRRAPFDDAIIEENAAVA